MNEKFSPHPFDDVIRRSYDVPEIRTEFVSDLSVDLMQLANKQVAKNTNRNFTLRLGLGFATIALLLGIFFTQAPAGRALADSISRFFLISSVTEIPIDNPSQAEIPTYAPTFSVTLAPAAIVRTTKAPVSTPDGFTLANSRACELEPFGYTCQIAWAEKKIGYDLKELPKDPTEYRFEKVFVQGYNDVQINYERIAGGSYLYFLQGQGSEFTSTGAGVPADAIQSVMVGENPGEFVAGVYAAAPGQTTFKWNPDSRYSLRWADDGRWFEITTYGCVGREDLCSAEGLIEVALTLVDQPVQAEFTRPDHLTNITEAEQISGLTLMEPAILPEGFVFSYASYDAGLKEIRLNYHPIGYDPGVAQISLWQSLLQNPATTSNGFTGETVDINGQPGQYSSPDGFTHTIVWQSGNIEIRMAVTSSDLWYGGTFTMEQVLEIARSVK